MSVWLPCLACLCLQAPQPPSRLGPVPSPRLPTASPKELQELSQRLREIILKSVPSPLYEAAPGWGQTASGFGGVDFGKRQIVKQAKNHGTWRKIKVTADDLPMTLIFDLRRLEKPTPKISQFDLYLAFDTRVYFTEQKWRKGLKYFDGQLRARMRVKVNLSCEVVLETRPSKYVLPDIIFRLQVKKATVSYDNLVVEHAFGLGGEAAKILGEVVLDVVKQVKPSLEKRLLERLEKSLVKALDNKEVKVGVGKLFQKK
jgi:hypothetical protein